MLAGFMGLFRNTSYKKRVDILYILNLTIIFNVLQVRTFSRCVNFTADAADQTKYYTTKYKHLY